MDAFSKLETLAPEESLISALRVRHGVLTEGGFLMITTQWLRYVKHGMVFTVIANDDFWPLDASLELKANVGDMPVFTTPDGSQFQIYPAVPIITRRQAKAFHGIYRLAALAIHHLEADVEGTAVEDAALPLAATLSTNIVAEIKDLVNLRDSGALSESEFDAAKARVLNS
ncbi:MAG TPA: SHOCT domain-containing protein [Solirubrobacteraceae bacterium]|nr:SHOCT domain-containing protein [Solirubrobacteraceae bacterium]